MLRLRGGGSRPVMVMMDGQTVFHGHVRRIAVLSWRRGYAIASAEVKAFVAAGYSPAFYELVVDTIASARQADSRRARR